MSARSVAERLLIKPNSAVWSSHAERLTLIEGLPGGVAVVGGPGDAANAIVVADDAGTLRDVLDVDAERCFADTHRHGMVLTARAENHLYGVDDPR